jgi:hypothetical protein
LTFSFEKKVFFSQGFSVRSVGAGKLFISDFPIQPGSIQTSGLKMPDRDLQMTITMSKN